MQTLHTLPQDLLEEIGGEPLPGSGFEDELPESDFAAEDGKGHKTPADTLSSYSSLIADGIFLRPDGSFVTGWRV